MKTIGFTAYVILAIFFLIASGISFLFAHLANLDTTGGTSGSGLLFSVAFFVLFVVCLLRAVTLSGKNKKGE
jgi:hypothetical protein